LSTLDINFFKKQSKVYLLISATVLAFSLVYQIFTHGIYSTYMNVSFIIPLIFGALISILVYNKKYMPSRISVNLYNASLATFTTFCLIKGVFEIAGTMNSLVNIYLVIGGTLLIASLVTISLNNKYRWCSRFWTTPEILDKKV